MPLIEVTQPFKFAERGVDVIEYPVGEHEVSARCAEVALAEKWARLPKAPPKNKALIGAPENKQR